MIRTLYVLMLTGLLSLLLACGTTVEKQEQRYKRNLDTIEALLAKHPMMRSAVAGKLAGFKTEHDKITGDDETRKNALVRLNRRMEEYVKKLDPSLAPKKATSSRAGSKLNRGKPGMAPKSALGRPGVAPTSGKLGGTPMGGTPTGGKLGGTAAPTGGKLGGTAAPTGGRLGGGAAAPGKLGAPKPGVAPTSGKLGGR